MLKNKNNSGPSAKPQPITTIETSVTFSNTADVHTVISELTDHLAENLKTKIKEAFEYNSNLIHTKIRKGNGGNRVITFSVKLASDEKNSFNKLKYRV